MKKMTFTLDPDAVRYVDQISERLAMSKSQVVREAIAVYHQELGKLSDDERRRALDTFDRVVPVIPDRPREQVEAELAEVREARRAGGRG